MKLVIDIGNTRCKWAIFDDGILIIKRITTDFTPQIVAQILGEFGEVGQAIISSVRDFPQACRDLLAERTDYFVELTHQTSIPIINRYKTPNTLGLDRLAASVGASSAFPGKPLLVIDAGTAITIDFVSAANEFIGGNISPGITTRFRALNQFTGKLPEVDLQDDFEILGTDTISAIRAGVQQGVIFEIDSYIDHYSEQFPELVTVLTGGDALFLAGKIKTTVEIIEDLTLKGLLEILAFNSNNS
ncbi:type III pantothenate kinase [Mangrovibacterium sp.]|uniref:type III pantothenate kinase n=1 Tax=Mangrovibacterium sp. TaxID=1961364 RepID=UPI0035677AFF